MIGRFRLIPELATQEERDQRLNGFITGAWCGFMLAGLLVILFGIMSTR